MSTIQDFENAPVGSTARRPGCPVAVKVTDLPTSKGIWDDGFVKMTPETLVEYGYVLDPVPAPAPTTAREAFDLAWNLAYPVKVGQAVPAGTEIISVRSEIERAYGTTLLDQVADGFDELHTRTLDPLPDPEPVWLDAPAVLAATVLEDRSEHRTVFARENETGTQWLRDTKIYRWDELVDVVPLYPKGQDE